MTWEKHRYYVARKGRAYFQATLKMRAAGFASRPLGLAGPQAWAEAERLYGEWRNFRRGIITSSAGKTYPVGSVGHAWERYRRLAEWSTKAPRTREEWDLAWKWIEPIFGDVAPSTIEVEDIDGFRAAILAKKGLHTAHRVTKIWRALWKVMARMHLCGLDEDPSLAITNSAPRGRSVTWKPGELARIGKRAWREGYRGLAALLAVAFDTQFSPVDCRSLTLAQRLKDARGTFFDTSRAKTRKAVIGTLSRRGERILTAYIKSLGVDLHIDAPIFRNRSGRPYSKDTLGDDFRLIRAMVFPSDTRRIMDIRRSGAVEAIAGEADAAALAAKMGNSINESKALQKTYLPKRAATVRLADEARKRGRQRLRENE